MVMGKVLKINAKTGKEEYVTEEVTLSPMSPKVKELDLNKLDKLITVAESKGWNLND